MLIVKIRALVDVIQFGERKLILPESVWTHRLGVTCQGNWMLPRPPVFDYFSNRADDSRYSFAVLLIILNESSLHISATIVLPSLAPVDRLRPRCIRLFPLVAECGGPGCLDRISGFISGELRVNG
jgi:hypothetical protein